MLKISQTSSQLTVQSKLGRGKYFLILFMVMFGGMPLFMMITILANRGVTTLFCQRIQSTEVTCEKSVSRFWGLVEQPATSLGTVSQATFQSFTTTDSEGDEVVEHFATLVTSQGQVNAFEGNAVQMQEYVARINEFIQANNNSLVVAHDTRSAGTLVFDVFVLAFIAIFPSVAAFGVYGILRTETQILDKNTRCLTRQSKTLLGTKQEKHTFKKIDRIEIVEKTDSDGDKFYYTKLVVEGDRGETQSLPLKIIGGGMNSTALAGEQQFAKRVHDFLRLETPIEVVPEKEEVRR
jgi:hypothetical protein